MTKTESNSTNEEKEEIKEIIKRKKWINRSSYASLGIGFLIVLIIVANLILGTIGIETKIFDKMLNNNFYIVIGTLFLFGFLGAEFVDLMKNTIKDKVGKKIEKYLEEHKEIEDKIRKDIESHLEGAIQEEVLKQAETKEDITNTLLENGKEQIDSKYATIMEKIEKSSGDNYKYIKVKQLIGYLSCWFGKIKFLELYTKNDGVTFRLRYKNNPKFKKIINENPDDFQKLGNEYWDTIFIDYRFDINDTKDLEKGLQYLNDCLNGYKTKRL